MSAYPRESVSSALTPTEHRLNAHLLGRDDSAEPYPHVGDSVANERGERPDRENDRERSEDAVVRDADGAVDVVRLDAEGELCASWNWSAIATLRPSRR